MDHGLSDLLYRGTNNQQVFSSTTKDRERAKKELWSNVVTSSIDRAEAIFLLLLLQSTTSAQHMGRARSTTSPAEAASQGQGQCRRKNSNHQQRRQRITTMEAEVGIHVLTLDAAQFINFARMSSPLPQTNSKEQSCDPKKQLGDGSPHSRHSWLSTEIPCMIRSHCHTSLHHMLRLAPTTWRAPGRPKVFALTPNMACQIIYHVC